MSKRKNFIGEVITTKVVRVSTPVDTIANDVEQATKKIQKKIDEWDDNVNFGNNRIYTEGSRNETLVSLETEIVIKEVE